MAIDLKRLQEKYNQLAEQKSKSSSSGLNYVKLKTGINVWRILPPESAEKPFHFRDTAMHYGIGPDEKNFVCLRAEGKICPICELRNALLNSKDEQLVELAANLLPKPKVYFNIIDRQHPELGVQIGTLTGKYAVEGVHEVIWAFMIDPKWGDLTDSQYGRDITIEKKGSGLDSEYIVRPDPTPSPIFPDKAMTQAVLTQLKNLDKIVRLTSEEEMMSGLADVQEIVSKLGLGSRPAGQGPAPLAKPEPAVEHKPEVKDRKFWIVDAKNEVVEVAEAEVQKIVDTGKFDFPCMLVGEADWKTPAAYGLKMKPPVVQKPPVPAKPAAPAKPVPPAKPAAPVVPAAPVKPVVPAAPIKPEEKKPAGTNGHSVQIPEEKKVCFGIKYDATKDDCMLCPYEAFCISTMKGTK